MCCVFTSLLRAKRADLFILADQTVQYRFCVPIIPKRDCDEGDLAVTIETDTGKWNPHVRDARCSCPFHTYQLLGWWRHPTQKHDNTTGIWIYEYFCDKVRTLVQLLSFIHYENTPIQYTVIFDGCKNDYFQMKKM